MRARNDLIHSGEKGIRHSFATKIGPLATESSSQKSSEEIAGGSVKCERRRVGGQLCRFALEKVRSVSVCVYVCVARGFVCVRAAEERGQSQTRSRRWPVQGFLFNVVLRPQFGLVSARSVGIEEDDTHRIALIEGGNRKFANSTSLCDQPS